MNAPIQLKDLVVPTDRTPLDQDDVGLQADQLLRERSYPIGVIPAHPPEVHPHVAAIGPT